MLQFYYFVHYRKFLLSFNNALRRWQRRLSKKRIFAFHYVMKRNLHFFKKQKHTHSYTCNDNLWYERNSGNLSPPMLSCFLFLLTLFHSFFFLFHSFLFCHHQYVEYIIWIECKEWWWWCWEKTGERNFSLSSHNLPSFLETKRFECVLCVCVWQ